MEEKTNKKFETAIKAMLECILDVVSNCPVNQKLADKLKLACEGYIEYYKMRFE